MHKQVRLPVFVDSANVLAQESDVIGADWPLHQGHLRLFGRLAPLSIIASEAGADQIFPGILSTTTLRHNVIHGEHNAGGSAVLTFVTIAPQNIFSGKDHLLKWYPYITREPNHAWERHGDGSRSDLFMFESTYEFGFLKIHKDDCLFYATDSKRFVIAVQYQHFAGERRMCREKIVIEIDGVGGAAGEVPIVGKGWKPVVSVTIVGSRS